MFSNLPLKVSGKLETDFSIPERRWIGRKDCTSLQLWTAKFTHLPPLPHHEFILLPIFLWLLLKCRKIRWSEKNSLMKGIFKIHVFSHLLYDLLLIFHIVRQWFTAISCLVDSRNLTETEENNYFNFLCDFFLDTSGHLEVACKGRWCSVENSSNLSKVFFFSQKCNISSITECSTKTWLCSALY